MCQNKKNKCMSNVCCVDHSRHHWLWSVLHQTVSSAHSPTNQSSWKIPTCSVGTMKQTCSIWPGSATAQNRPWWTLGCQLYGASKLGWHLGLWERFTKHSTDWFIVGVCPVTAGFLSMLLIKADAIMQAIVRCCLVRKRGWMKAWMDGLIEGWI